MDTVNTHRRGFVLFFADIGFAESNVRMKKIDMERALGLLMKTMDTATLEKLNLTKDTSRRWLVGSCR